MGKITKHMERFCELEKVLEERKISTNSKKGDGHIKVPCAWKRALLDVFFKSRIRFSKENCEKLTQ